MFVKHGSVFRKNFPAQAIWFRSQPSYGSPTPFLVWGRVRPAPDALMAITRAQSTLDRLRFDNLQQVCTI